MPKDVPRHIICQDLLKAVNRQLRLAVEHNKEQGDLIAVLQVQNAAQSTQIAHLGVITTRQQQMILTRDTQIARLQQLNQFQQQTIAQQSGKITLLQSVIDSQQKMLEEKEKRISKQAKELAKLQLVKHERKVLSKMKFGRQSEKTSSKELTRPREMDTTAASDIPAGATIVYTNNWPDTKDTVPHQGRTALDPNLPREIVIIKGRNLPEGAIKIAEEITETLECRKVEMYVKRTIRYVYLVPGAKGEDSLKNYKEPLPPHPIPKCKAGVSTLVQILIDKYLYALPLFRQAARFEQHGVLLPYSTIVDWSNRTCEALEALHKLMIREAVIGGLLHLDESPIVVIDKQKGTGSKAHRGQMWVLVNPVQKIACFNYGKGRGHKDIQEILEGYKGFMMTDALGTYKKYGKQKGVKHGKCLAHCRRKFKEAQYSDPGRAKQVLLNYMAPLYGIEKMCRKQRLSFDEITEIRQKHSVPILIAMFEWLEDQRSNVLPRTPIAIAIHYILNMKEEIMLYTTDGMLPIDNNAAERLIRSFALGRKNYLFAGSHKGAQNAAIIYSFICTCKLQGIHPSEWLEDVLNRMADHPPEKLHELLPQFWKPTQAANVA